MDSSPWVERLGWFRCLQGSAQAQRGAASRHRAMPSSGAPAPPGRTLTGQSAPKQEVKQDKYKTEHQPTASKYSRSIKLSIKPQLESIAGTKP
ncbi:hypothetical protein [Pontibacter chitinilyticus]|uniref:hypothetical protein n=1 Tax=Pontibacter chitinilyticus TaxID=2674989 RepID=UPI00321B85CC